MNMDTNIACQIAQDNISTNIECNWYINKKNL